MAKTTTCEWAIGEWAGRASLNYVPIDTPISGRYFVQRSGNKTLAPAYQDRIPYKVEVTGEGVTYLAYSSDSPTEIVRYTEE